MFRNQRKDQSCWGVMIKKSGSMSLRGDWVMQFSVHREPVRELKGEVKLSSLLCEAGLPSGKVRPVAGIPLSECWEDAKERSV